MASSKISKYIPLNTTVHKLDPRAKLFFVILYLINVFLATKLSEFILLIVILLMAIVLSKITLQAIIFSLKSITLLIVFTSLVHIVFNKSGNILLSFYGFSLYSGAMYGTLLITVRFALVVIMMIIFMTTTSPTQITYAIEKSLGFLNYFKIPVSTFALVLSISLRFIPTIEEETARIINAQLSRGSNFNEGNLVTKIKKFIPILIPLFIATLKRADELATAMEVRGYSLTKQRTRYKILKYDIKDYLSYMLIIVITIVIAYM